MFVLVHGCRTVYSPLIKDFVAEICIAYTAVEDATDRPIWEFDLGKDALTNLEGSSSRVKYHHDRGPRTCCLLLISTSF